MGHPRPRRALRPRLAVRAARVVVPGVMVGMLGLGVAVATWPGEKTETAYPAPAVQPVLPAEAPAGQEPDGPATTGPSPSATRTPSVEPSASSAKAKAKTKAKTKAKAKAKPTATTTPSAKPTTSAEPKPAPKPKPLPNPPLKVVDTEYATASLKVRAGASFEAEIVDVVSAGDVIRVTKAVRNGFRFISYNDRGRWISDKYLSDTKPKVSTGSTGGGSSSGISSASCSKSSSIESGLVPNAIKVYRALCARYPAISSFGGRRPGDDGFHGSGQAVDVMIADSSVGWAMAEWARANARALGASEVIYYRKIWTVERSSEGWRPMADRGSVSANHEDHVHVSVY